MKSKLYILIPWPNCQGLDEIEAIKNEIIHPMSEDPSIANSILIPVDLAADYLDGEVINDEFIWDDPIPEDQKYLVKIYIHNASCLLKCNNKDLILRVSICVQEMFKAGTFIDERGWLTVDKPISQDQWVDLFKEKFNFNAITLAFKD